MRGALGLSQDEYKTTNSISLSSHVAIWCSPMRRTCETALPLAESIGVSPILDEEIFEMHGPFLSIGGLNVPQTGTRPDAIKENFPVMDVSRIHPNGWYHGKSFETHEDCQQRAHGLLGRLRGEAKRLSVLDSEASSKGLAFPQHSIVVVSHGNFLAEVMKQLFRIESDQCVGFSLGNASISKVLFWSDTGSDDNTGAFAVDYLFDTSHLSAIEDSFVTGTSMKGMYVASPNDAELGLL